MKNSFVPGFGVTISEAVQCSCAAYPIFNKKTVVTENQGKQVSLDGGFVANNPTLFALIDATQSLGRIPEDLRVLNVGVGNYVEKPISIQNHIVRKLDMAKLVTKVLNANTNTTEILTKLLYPQLKIAVVNETFSQPEYGTNMVEQKIDKLQLMFRLGRESFAKHEKDITQLLQ
jgi:patatin-like phospholipase/acyl hydrolase